MSNAAVITVNRRPYPGQSLRLLALHADYACANTGLCCEDKWGIRLHDEEAARIEAVLAEHPGDPHLPAPGSWCQREDLGELGDVRMCSGPHGCLFHEHEGAASSCQLHRRFGPVVLPTICQSYPRMAVRTPAGIYLTLSCACPTAAALLTQPGALREVAPGRVYTGGLLGGSIFSDTTQPPRFSPACQPPWQAFDYFWRWAPEWLANPALTPAEALFGLGLIVGHIEGLGAAAAQPMTLIDQLDPLVTSFAPQLAGIATRTAPQLMLGVVYLEALLNVGAAMGALSPELETLRPAGLGEAERRAALLADYERLIRPTIGEWALIERNYIGARLYANPLAYRAASLRAGYFLVVLMAVALRYAALGHCRLSGRPLDAELLLRAAGTVDRLLLHDSNVATRLLEILAAHLGGDIRNLAQPALT